MKANHSILIFCINSHFFSICSGCFNDRDELYSAVRKFHQDGCSNSNNCNNLIVKKYGWPMGSWCVSNVNSMNLMFVALADFNDDISTWDTSKVTDMSYMFYNARTFKRNLSLLNTSKVTNMEHMFQSAREFNHEIGKWDTS